VGSSANRICGRQARAMAIITRWRMPPDIWCGYSAERFLASGCERSQAARSPWLSLRCEEWPDA
jgi:hypothetical protein